MKPGGSGGRHGDADPVADASAFGVELSDRQAQLLLRYRELLLDRAVPLGMVAKGDAGRIYRRHLLDSLTAAVAFRSSDRLAYDLGSGAGLPGVALAVALPRVAFVLVEARRRRAGFLELVIEVLGLANATVVPDRAESLEDGGDMVTARAFAPMERSWEAARRLLRPGGRLVYFGSGHPPELERRARAMPEVGDVAVVPVLDSSRPLVIMART